jgi:hypothetical protein
MKELKAIRATGLEITLSKSDLLFSELEECINRLTSLSYDGEEDLMCLEAAVFCANKDYNNALKALKDYVTSTELRAQAGGVM